MLSGTNYGPTYQLCSKLYSRPSIIRTSVIRHHFRVNSLIDFAVLLIALISSHVYFNLQLHFLTSSCIFLTSEYAAVPS